MSVLCNSHIGLSFSVSLKCHQKGQQLPEEAANKWRQRVKRVMAGMKLVHFITICGNFLNIYKTQFSFIYFIIFTYMAFPLSCLYHSCWDGFLPLFGMTLHGWSFILVDVQLLQHCTCLMLDGISWLPFFLFWERERMRMRERKNMHVMCM